MCDSLGPVQDHWRTSHGFKNYIDLSCGRRPDHWRTIHKDNKPCVIRLDLRGTTGERHIALKNLLLGQRRFLQRTVDCQRAKEVQQVFTLLR